jgi:lysophospholipase L1-like esterase
MLLFMANCVSTTNDDFSYFMQDSLTVGNIVFPDDSVYNRALVSKGSNWRMHRFIDKCKSQSTIKVGFIGGSITAGASASNESLKFSSLFCSSVKKSFSNLNDVVEINAGIGGTDSRFGCSRIQSDLLSYSPDMIIIEYAVNDYGIGDTAYQRSVYEGVVRQCLIYKEDVPVILLFMSRWNGTNVQDIQSDIGAFYSLPTISYRDAIWPIVENDTNNWYSFFSEDTHPNDTGHWVCACLLSTYLKDVMTSAADPQVEVPSFYYSDLYQEAGFMSTTDSTVSLVESSWILNTDGKGRNNFTSTNNGDSMSIYAKCDEVTLFIDGRPDSISYVRVTVDDNIIDTTFDNYYYVEHQILYNIYMPSSSKEHVVKIKHTNSSAFDICYILYAKHPD